MIGLLIRWLAPFLAILIAARLFPSWFAVQSFEAAAVFALVLALLNAVVRPVLAFFAFPITCLTLGLFHFVLNAIIFVLAAWVTQQLGQVVEVNGFIAALVGSLIVSAVSLGASLVAR